MYRKNRKYLKLSHELTCRQPLVLFDGECTLCSRAVRFLIRHNKSGNLSFASLQSEAGLLIVKLAGIPTTENETLLLIEDNYIYSYSTAALKITSHLDFPYSLLRIFKIIPGFLRDRFYRTIARNRYKWFGKERVCINTENEYSQRFIS